MADVKLIAVGDTGPGDGVQNIFESVLPWLKEGDLRFAQCERLLTDRGYKIDHSTPLTRRVNPKHLVEYEKGGFDVVSMATNHAMDYGPEGALDTIAGFHKRGIATIGLGANIAEARKPAFFEKNGVTIAFLGYCSVITNGASLPPGYWATERSAGMAPMRARTYYEPYDFQPATPPHVYSVAEEADVEAMREDIKAARAKADFVVVSNHWGVHHVPRYVAHYQIQAAHAAIDAGCDLILGHHPHILKGVEVYKGKPILYSMGNFAWDGKHSQPTHSYGAKKSTPQQYYAMDLGPKIKLKYRQYWSLSVIVEATLSKENGVSVSLVPVYLDDESIPRVVKPGDPLFDEIIEFQIWSSEPFGTKWEVRGDRLFLIS
jgi:poly-gamma-glutamate synthesis protein (capsule biosynthesis protein)